MSLAVVELTRILLAIALLLGSAQFFGHFFFYFRLPRVIGEILGGLLLGPTVLGHFWPAWYGYIFQGFAFEPKLLGFVSSLGLFFLMFLSGFEIEHALTKRDYRVITILLLGATLLPFGAGLLASHLFNLNDFVGTLGNLWALKMLIALSVAVTSIPVISKIFLELKLSQTRFAKLIVGTAVFEDIILWCVLAVVTGVIATGSASVSTIARTVVVTLAFFGVALLVMPKVISWCSTSRFNLVKKSSAASYVMVIGLLFAMAASALQVNMVFGALLAGMLLARIKLDELVIARVVIKEFSTAFFVPLYFATVGLQLDLVHHFNFWLLVGFLLFATVAKVIGTIIAVRVLRWDLLSSFNTAVALNTRGGPGIVLATVGFQAGIINESFFVILVMVAIITSLVSGTWFRYVVSKKWELLKEAS